MEVDFKAFQEAAKHSKFLLFTNVAGKISIIGNNHE